MGQNTNTSIAPLCAKILTDFENRCIIFNEGDYRFRVTENGETSVLVHGMEFPVSGCPIPERLAVANFQFFLFRYRKVWPVLIASIILLVLLQWLLWLLPDSPLTEMKWNFVALFSFWMNTALLVTAAAPLFVLVAREVILSLIALKPDSALELAETNFSLGKDVFIYAEENEQPAQFAARAFEAQKNIKAGIFVVVIPFQNSGGVVIRKGENEKTNPFDSYPFLRENPPYQTADFSGEIEKRGFRFSDESFGDYRNYLARFAFYFREYAKSEKIKLKMEGHLEQILEF